MLNLHCRKALTVCLFSAIVVIICSSAASAYGPSDAHTWGINNAGMNIAVGNVITNAKLTIRNAAFDPASSVKTATVHLLNNPDVGMITYTDGQTGDYFAGCGTLLATLKSGSLTSSNVVIDLSKINDPASPIWQNFGQPFEVTLGTGVKVSYTSSLVALLDYAGSGRSFGFGVDCDGFNFTDMSLELTVASMNNTTPAQTLLFSTSNNNPPALEPIADKTVQSGQPLQFTVSAADPDGNALVYSASGLPAGASFANRLFSWTPASGQEGVYHVTFNVSDGIASVSITVNITVTGTTSSTEVIIDNTDAAVSMVGAWPVSGGANPYGTDSVYNRQAGNSFSWLFTAPETASYDVSMWWTEFSSRSTAAPVQIENAAGIASTTVNQTANGGQWNPLGTFQFQAGTTYRVTVSTLADNSTVCADAVRFTRGSGTTPPPPAATEVIIDDTDAAVTSVGTWAVSGGVNPYGADSVYNRQAGNSFSWLFTAPETASYDVSMWWTEFTSRSTAAPVQIQHAGGTAAMTVNQFTNGGKWNPLGTYQFETGKTYRVTVSTLADNSTVCADAVRFTKGTGTTPPPPVNNPPVIAPIANQSVTIPNTLTFAVQASDPDGDNVTITAQNMPAGAAFSGGVFNWTPSAAQAGAYTVTFIASDGKGLTASTAVQITVVSAPSSQWQQLTFDDFESGWGNYTAGGADCLLYKQTKYAHQGKNAADIQSGSGTAASFALTTGRSVSAYSELKIDFWYMPVSMETNDAFRLDYYDGSQWRTLKRWVAPTDFKSFSFYSESVAISKSNYAFPANMKIRFVCEAGDKNDDVMIDEIAISAR